MNNRIKRALGWIWLLLAPIAICLLVAAALDNIDAAGARDINKPLPWIIILLVFVPIATGLMIFGYYCIKGEYDQIQSHDELV